MDKNTWIEAFDEMMESGELKSLIDSSVSYPSKPSLDIVLSHVLPLPPEALFLGMADDGNPLLLNMYDSKPQSLLFCGDKEYLQLKALRTIANFIEKTKTPTELQFAVISKDISRWEDIVENNDNCVGVYEPYTEGADNILLSLASWAHGNKTSKQFVILLIDDIDFAASKINFDAKQNLRWLLLRGASRYVWTIASSTIQDSASRDDSWTEMFKTKMFSNKKYSLIEKHNHPIKDLDDGYFATWEWEKENWLKFWIPEE